MRTVADVASNPALKRQTRARRFVLLLLQPIIEGSFLSQGQGVCSWVSNSRGQRFWTGDHAEAPPSAAMRHVTLRPCRRTPGPWCWSCLGLPKAATDAGDGPACRPGKPVAEGDAEDRHHVEGGHLDEEGCAAGAGQEGIAGQEQEGEEDRHDH